MRRSWKPWSTGAKGFTVIELVVSLLVASVAMVVTLFISNGMTKQLRNTKNSVTAQSNARIAVDEITRQLRGAGSGTDYSNGQSRLLYAAPFTVAFNANMQPIDDPAGNGEPAALDVTLADATVPLEGADTYTAPMTFGTGAETVVLTLDSNRDGTIGAADASDDAEEASENPNDYVLKAFVHGRVGAANSTTATGVAVLRGPTVQGSSTAEPLFKYWIDGDNDPSTASVLHGDANSDGQLSGSEQMALTAVAADQLALIERIEVASAAESEKPRHGDVYSQTVQRSSISFRNRTNTASRVVGYVFNDLDSDGARDPGELGIRDVVIRSSSNSATKTDVDGRYQFVMSPGVYTITEIDPHTYTSTTSNVVPVNLAPGAYLRVDFGDHSTIGVGTIQGTVYNDTDGDAVLDVGERKLVGIQVFLDTGQSVTTNTAGRYSFTVQTQDYIVTEVDSAGYTSITPNVVEVNLQSAGDSVVVNFADQKIPDSGTIHGIVYRDDDNDGVKDTNEPGVANVSVNLDGNQSINTTSAGEFVFTAAVGAHVVTETDPPGYTSSTVNVVHVTVVRAQTVEVRFGDIAAQDVSFQEITLGNTNRALSISSLDTGEDNKSDTDLILGTHYVGGQNDILVWWNNRNNSSTPNSGLFTTTATYQRVIAADVNALVVPDLNGDGRQDCVSALGSATNNMNVWLTQGGGNKGLLPNSPTSLFTAAGATSVNDIVTGHFDNNSNLDYAIGTTTGAFTGKIEIWHGTGSGSFTRNNGNDVLANAPGDASNWGQIVSLASADFTNDGAMDLVVASRTGIATSKIYLLGWTSASGGGFTTITSFAVSGLVNDVLALNMFEDDLNDVDILVALESSSSAGRVDLWCNRGDNYFGTGDTPNTTPDDTIDPAGSPLCIGTAKIDNDIFPDLVVGTRTTTYSGRVLVYRCFGFLPSTGTNISTTNVGEVITQTSADYNKDGAPDLAVGTRSSATSGKVVVYFNTRSAI